MFKTEELNYILKALNYSTSNLEVYIDKYNNYLSYNEKKDMLNQMERYNGLSTKIEGIIGSKEAQKILEGNFG